MSRAAHPSPAPPAAGDRTLHLESSGRRPGYAGTREVALIDLLDRLLEGGVTIQGEITLCAAGIDLVELDLRVLIAAVDKAAGR